MCNKNVCWNGAGEPAVAELLADPMIDLLLRRDGLTRDEVWAAVEQARLALRAVAERPERPAAA